MHLVVPPLAFIDSAIIPFIDTTAVDIVVQKIAMVKTAVCEAQGTLSVLQAIDVVSLELGTVWSCLFAFAVLSIVLSESLIPSGVN